VGVLLLLQTKQGINARRHIQQQTGSDTTCSHAVVTYFWVRQSAGQAYPVITCLVITAKSQKTNLIITLGDGSSGSTAIHVLLLFPSVFGLVYQESNRTSIILWYILVQYIVGDDESGQLMELLNTTHMNHLVTLTWGQGGTCPASACIGTDCISLTTEQY
jgi:hypothetical protein